MTHSGKLLLKENLHSLDYHLTIINEANEPSEYEEPEIFENLAKKTYNVADVMTKNAKRLGEEFYKQCETIIKTMEGAEISVYYTWMMYCDKMEYLKFLYLHKIDPLFEIPQNLNMNCVELEPELVYDRLFRVFFAVGGDRNEEMLEYLKKWKRVYETAKIVPIYDDYMDLQDENAELRERYVNRRKRASDFKHFIKGEEKEEGG